MSIPPQGPPGSVGVHYVPFDHKASFGEILHVGTRLSLEHFSSLTRTPFSMKYSTWGVRNIHEQCVKIVGMMTIFPTNLCFRYWGMTLDAAADEVIVCESCKTMQFMKDAKKTIAAKF